ncbi:methyltransferase-like protein 22 isoform X4 [Diabrotica virgifera virgifera]|uniref:Methyltransferase-like protein 22 n=1 Tax=Diabrotica virgifera virgifera TaxID=50390 RepID=A0ABM5KYH0_DIAVI|nr:methyltransferase-like protein 22 isoform X4 [Diabrotica virgifera virgifera]
MEGHSSLFTCTKLWSCILYRLLLLTVGKYSHILICQVVQRFKMDDEVSSEIYQENNYFTRKKPTFDDKKHKQSTIIDMVGLQIWRGALLLADWLIYNHEEIPKDSVILELGSGVGLTSVVASMYFPVICTDVNRGNILGLIESNVTRNKNLSRHAVRVLELDFLSPDIPGEILEQLPNISVIIAADTVYDDTITEAFVRTVHRLVTFSPSPAGKRSVYIALEKRFVFTLSECDTVAPCYEYYLKCLDKLTGVKCEEVSLAFPKSFEYDRVKELVLWKVTSV